MIDNKKNRIQHTKLGVIVPIGMAVDNFDNLSSWLTRINGLNISVILILDSTDAQTRFKIENLLNSLDCSQYLLLISPNLGPGGARNLGLKYIKCDWVVFWDSDDVADPIVTLQVIMQHESKANLILANYSVVDSKTLATLRTSSDNSLFDVTLNPGLWRVIFKRNLVGKIEFPELFMGEDQVFLARVMAKKHKLVMDMRVIYHYYINYSGQLTNSRDRIHELPRAAKLLARELENSNGVQVKFISGLLTRILLTSFSTLNLKVILETIASCKSSLIKINKMHALAITATVILLKIKGKG